MPETIESFVAKLRAEGVETGKAEAEEICQAARQTAADLLEKANQQAEAILARAQAEAKEVSQRSQVQLELAVRDSIYRFRETLEDMLSKILTGPVEDTLDDWQFIATLLEDIITQYIQADSQQVRRIEVHVPPKMQEKLTAAALKSLRAAICQKTAGQKMDGPDKPLPQKPVVDIQGILQRSGIEYSAGDGTVDVSVESVVAMLMDYVGPQLREKLQGALE